MGVELLIVCTTRPSAAALALMTAPGARIIYAPASATDQQLRAMGLAAAAGDVVMLVDEAAEADEGWMERLCAGRGSGVDSARTEEDAHLQP